MMPNEVKDMMRVIILFMMRHSKKIAVLILLALLGISSWIYLPFDNEIEQFAENEIEKISGFKIDLSP